MRRLWCWLRNHDWRCWAGQRYGRAGGDVVVFAECRRCQRWRVLEIDSIDPVVRGLIDAIR